MSKDINILIVDGKKKLAEIIIPAFARKGITVNHAPDIRTAFRLYKKEKPLIILQKIEKSSQSISLRFMQRIKSLDDSATFIVLSKKPSLESVVQSIKAGASDYMTGDIDVTELEKIVEQLLMQKKAQRENDVLFELAALHKATLSFFSSHQYEELLPLVLKTCLGVVNADSGSVMSWHESEPHLQIEAAKGLRKRYRNETTVKHVSLFGEWVCKNKRSLRIANGQTYPETPLPVQRDSDSSSLILPIYTSNKTIGVINLNRRSSVGQFTDQDVSIAEVLARQASIAIANTQNTQHLSRQVNNLRVIHGFGENLMQFTERESIIDFVLVSMIQAFGADVVALLMPVKRRFEFHLSSTRKMAASFSENIIHTVTQNLPVQIKVPRHRIKTIQRMGAKSKQSFLKQRILKHNSYQVCPLWSHEKWIGAIYIGSSKKNIFDKNTKTQLTSIARQTGISLMNARLYEEIKENHLRTIKALAIAVDAKDKYTRGHSENVMKYAVAITEEMGILDSRINEDLQNAALLHDIGKIGVPGNILNKPGKLTPEEFNGTMKKHAETGATIIQEVPFLQDIVPLILHHHERYDGNGYPNGLKGDKIPVGARILTVADSFEAMTSDRPYRKALSREKAIEQLIVNRGTQFDPYIVDIFMTALGKEDQL